MQDFRNERLTRVVNFLKAAGYIKTAKELAEKMGRNRSALSEMMSGYRPVTDKFIHDLCAMFPELNLDFFYDLKCEQMLKADAENAVIAAGVINSIQSRETPAVTPEQKALVDGYIATIKYLQEHIKELSAIITNLTKAR